jgi:hypothetical protein
MEQLLISLKNLVMNAAHIGHNQSDSERFTPATPSDRHIGGVAGAYGNDVLETAKGLALLDIPAGIFCVARV